MTDEKATITAAAAITGLLVGLGGGRRNGEIVAAKTMLQYCR